jgi:hypothetical protein
MIRLLILLSIPPQGESADWRAGYKYELGGELEKSVKANQAIADKVPVAGFIILFLLVAQFNSLRRPLIILLTTLTTIGGLVPGFDPGVSGSLHESPGANLRRNPGKHQCAPTSLGEHIHSCA